MRRVWPQSFVEEGNLARHVSTLRKALGETPKAHQFIATVPGYGYKFVAPIKEVRETPSIRMIAEQTVSTTVIEEEISLPAIIPVPRTLSSTQKGWTATHETKGGQAKLLIVAAACLAVMVLAALLILRKEKTAEPATPTSVKLI